MLNFWSILSNTIIKIRGPIMSVIDLHISGVKAESFESWYSWFLPFLPRWFTIPTRIFFQIHYSRRLLITYWLNDFLSGNLVSFRIVSSVFKVLLHQDAVSSFVWYKYGVFFFPSLNINTISPDYTNFIGGPGACSPGKILENWTLWNAISCIPRIERN